MFSNLLLLDTSFGSCGPFVSYRDSEPIVDPNNLWLCALRLSHLYSPALSRGQDDRSEPQSNGGKTEIDWSEVEWAGNGHPSDSREDDAHAGDHAAGDDTPYHGSHDEEPMRGRSPDSEQRGQGPGDSRSSSPCAFVPIGNEPASEGPAAGSMRSVRDLPAATSSRMRFCCGLQRGEAAV